MGSAWEAVIDLNGQVQNIIGGVGLALFGILFVGNNACFLLDDVKLPARALKRWEKSLAEASGQEWFAVLMLCEWLLITSRCRWQDSQAKIITIIAYPRPIPSDSWLQLG